MSDPFLAPEQLEAAAELLLRGGILAFPTDTVYGLGALPTNAEAVGRLFEAKRRPIDKAIPYLLADLDALDAVAISISTAARTLAEAFWPGGLTIVVERRERSPELPNTVAVRVPDLTIARALIRIVGGVLAVTSANRSGAANCTTATAVYEQLGSRIDGILDGDDTPGGIESTIVDATTEVVRVLRLGAISQARLREVVELA